MHALGSSRASIDSPAATQSETVAMLLPGKLRHGCESHCELAPGYVPPAVLSERPTTEWRSAVATTPINILRQRHAPRMAGVSSFHSEDRYGTSKWKFCGLM